MKKLKIISGDRLFRESMKDPAFKKAYEDLEPEFQIAQAVLDARIKRNLTQKQLAEKIGTKQPAIARLEGMGSVPTINLLKKIAESLGKKLIISFE